MAKRRILPKCGSRKSLSSMELVELLITNCKDALDEKAIKVTVGDLIRMRHLKKEFYPGAVPTRVVTWVDGWD
jgi:hypothetical protein